MSAILPCDRKGTIYAITRLKEKFAIINRLCRAIPALHTMSPNNTNLSIIFSFLFSFYNFLENNSAKVLTKIEMQNSTSSYIQWGKEYYKEFESIDPKIEDLNPRIEYLARENSKLVEDLNIRPSRKAKLILLNLFVSYFLDDE